MLTDGDPTRYGRPNATTPFPVTATSQFLDVTLHDIGVDDNRIPGTITSCGHRTLEPNHYTICEACYVITADDVERGQVINFAHAVAKDPGGRAIASAKARYEVGPPEVPVTG